MEIEYRALLEYHGYRFGSDGSVWTRWTQAGTKGRSVYQIGPMWRLLNLITNEGGYFQINLRKSAGGIQRNILVHHLILKAFGFKRPSPKHEGCHNDGKKTNNAISNLRWDTRKANAKDAILHGTLNRRRGKRLTDGMVQKVGELRRAGENRIQIATITGLSLASVRRAIRKGKSCA